MENPFENSPWWWDSVQEAKNKPVAAAPSGCVLRVQKSLSWHAAAAAAVMIKCMLLHSMQLRPSLQRGVNSLTWATNSRRGEVVVGRPRSHPSIAWRKRWQNGENNGLGVLRCCFGWADLNARTRREPQRSRAAWECEAAKERTRARDTVRCESGGLGEMAWTNSVELLAGWRTFW